MSKFVTFLFSLVIVLSLATVNAQAGIMKLLTPEVGWTLAAPGLMWTTDAGGSWTNITPTLSQGEYVSSVFFLNTETGWALLSSPLTGSGTPHLRLAFSHDAGATWSYTPVRFAALPPGRDLYGPVDMYFLDASHGWIDMSLVSSAAARLGALLATSDGGRTWQWVNSPGRAGKVFFLTAKDGWLSGGPAGKLYVTRDGAGTWHDVSLQPPPQAGKAIYPTYGLPVFQNGEDGFLPVTFSGTEGVRSVVVMFATDDGGRTWTPDVVVPSVLQTSLGQRLPTSIVDSTLITGGASNHTLTLTRATRQGRSSTNASIKLVWPAVTGLSFDSALRGWALVKHKGSLGTLLSTSDGGRSWTDITPRPSFAPRRR